MIIGCKLRPQVKGSCDAYGMAGKAAPFLYLKSPPFLEGVLYNKKI
jgi:hypothetical protein